MGKLIGMSVNKVTLIGRVIGNPAIENGWATLTLRTVVPELVQGGGWNEIEIDVPLMASDTKKIDTIQKYVADERQLYVEGYLKYWNVNDVKHSGVVVTLIKLGAKTMYDSDAGNANTSGMPGLPAAS